MNFDKFFTFVFQLIYFYDIYPGFKVQSSVGQIVVTSSVEKYKLIPQMTNDGRNEECGTHAATLLTSEPKKKLEIQNPISKGTSEPKKMLKSQFMIWKGTSEPKKKLG